MDSYTYSSTQTFTLTHARHLAAKVATDLRRMQRLYNEPSDKWIADYETEVTELLRQGYLGTATYGFKRNGEWIEPTLRYTANDLYKGSTDDDPGRVVPGKNVVGATFYSYMTYSLAWDKLTGAQQNAIKQALPFQRTGADQPSVANGGYFAEDKNYSAGGRSLSRASVRS